MGIISQSNSARLLSMVSRWLSPEHGEPGQRYLLAAVHRIRILYVLKEFSSIMNSIGGYFFLDFSRYTIKTLVRFCEAFEYGG